MCCSCCAHADWHTSSASKFFLQCRQVGERVVKRKAVSYSRKSTRNLCREDSSRKLLGLCRGLRSAADHGGAIACQRLPGRNDIYIKSKRAREREEALENVGAIRTACDSVYKNPNMRGYYCCIMTKFGKFYITNIIGSSLFVSILLKHLV